MMTTAWKTSSAGILPAVPRASRPRPGGRGRPPDSRRDGGATPRLAARSSPRVILSLYVWGSTTRWAKRSAEDFLPGNLWLPDERPRLGKGRGDAGAAGIPAGGNGRAGGPDPVQHLLHPRQGRAESLSSPGRLQEAAGPGQALRSAGLRGTAGGGKDFRARAACVAGVRLGLVP